jgi:putative ABC transport system substrate-binding protein
VIVVSGGPAVTAAAKAATSTIPVIFGSAEDPVRLGFVASLARPGGNLTGINFLNRELATKQLELLRELVPKATRLAALVNPANAAVHESVLREVELGARALGLQVEVLNAGTSREIDAAFATLVRERCDALFVAADAFFNSRRLQLSLLAMRHAVPAIYSGREFAEAGGLITYGSDITDAYHQIGIYSGRVLKGARPADLPVVQSTKLELVINHQTARTLGLTVPDKLLVAADEVIE